MKRREEMSFMNGKEGGDFRDEWKGGRRCQRFMSRREEMNGEELK